MHHVRISVPFIGGSLGSTTPSTQSVTAGVTQPSRDGCSVWGGGPLAPKSPPPPKDKMTITKFGQY